VIIAGIGYNTERKIVKDYKNFMSQQKIAKKYKVCRDTISRILSKHGVPRNTNYVADRFKRQIIEQYNSNKTILQIANRYKISYNAVKMLLKRNGVKILSHRLRALNRYTIDNNGYKIVKMTDADLNRFGRTKSRWYSIPEHRLIMMRYLDRALKKYETVHHLNGDRTDNRLENLELWSSYQPAGQRVIDKIKYAKEILKQYKDFIPNKQGDLT
jgi:DNA-binding CsgD family transcriptional regulator